MKDYMLTREAEGDLFEIAGYTKKHWGMDQFRLYRDGLEAVFKSIASKPFHSFSKVYPDLRVTKYRYHYIFYFLEQNIPLIIGVIHEKRDLVSCLNARSLHSLDSGK